MVVKRVPGSKRARVEKINQINCFSINFLKGVIAVDVLMETSNEFLQQKMPPSRSLQNIKCFGKKVFWLIRSQVSENKCAYIQLPM